MTRQRSGSADRCEPDHDCATALAGLLATVSRERAAEIAVLVLELQVIREPEQRTPLVSRIRDALAPPPHHVLAAVVPLPTRPPAPGFPGRRLTARERVVLSQLATGAANREIAERLFISEGTVKTHVKQIFRKLGVHSRAAAVAAHLTTTACAGAERLVADPP